ncbi:uncharacterized protein LOC5574703 isoform X2 [Aedes aegypti]|nr:uncharacterized protein LOC5574703 isoform X2 [Aedes aegypti]
MGNSLCKEPRAGSSMRPGRVLDRFGNIMCPSGLNKNKHGINKTYLSRHVLETSSKPNTLSGWSNVPLASPESSKVIDRAPVAPPRKKRATLERGTSPDAMMKVRNGFKDVFGAESRRQSCDVVVKGKSLDTVDKSFPLKSQSSFEIDVKDEEFSDFSKVPTKTEMEPSSKDSLHNEGKTQVSRVGNRKSDKFFGENLSDALSGVPVVVERRKSAKKGMADLDKIDQFIEKNVLNMNAKPDSKDVPEIKVTEPDLNPEKSAPKLEEPKSEKVKDSPKDKKSDEENLMRYIDESMIKETSLGKKAEFLMAMLEDYPEDRYLGMTPVEEPIIVPRKRKSRHICDNDEHMHDMLHKHECKDNSSKNLITTEASIETPPRKPDRDFSKYLAPRMGDGDETDDSTCSGPVRRRSVQQAPPSPPVLHRMLKSRSETEFQQNISDTVTSTPKKLDATVETKAHSPRTLKRIISMPTTINLAKQESRSPSPRPTFVKSNSSSSFLIMDLQQAHKKVVPFTPEDPQHNVPDDLVKPKSRLAIRKISTKSNESASCISTPTLEIPAPKFTIGSSECLSKPPDVEPPPPPVPKRRKTSTGDSKPSSPRGLLGYDLGGFLVSSNILPHHDITQVINSVYNEKNNGVNIVEAFQIYLEDQINAELNNPDTKNPNTVKLLEALTKQSDPEDRLEDINIDLVDSENSNKSSDIDDCFDPEFEKIEKTEVEEAVQHHGSVDDVDNWFDNNSDAGSVIEGSDKLGTMVTVKNGVPRTGRRESIEDVDNWFKNHIQSSLLDEQIIGVRKQRRGSDGLLGYDTTRQYPFGAGRQRHDSQSAELFEDITKLHDLGSEEDVKGKTQLSVVKNDRLRDRRGSDGLVFYDTTRKFPFGEPNENLPKALEKSQKDERKTSSNNEISESKLSKANVEKHTAKEQVDGSSDHSTLLKFLSKENLVE